MQHKKIKVLIHFIYRYYAILALPIFIFLALNRTSRFDNFDYHSPVFSDGAGYYSYLVNFFAADVISDLPTNISQLTGDAFNVNREKNIIETKYTSGTAVLITPFFLLGNLIDNITGGNEDVFSRYYTNWVIFAACFYAALCLLLFQKIVFRLTKNHLMSLLIPLIFFIGTNIYFYAFDHCGFSHIYSMFCFAAIVYFTPNFYNNASIKYFMLLFFLLGIAVICRPTNAFFGLYFLFYQDETCRLKNRIRFFINNYKLLLLGVIIFILALSPQLYYWHNLTGKFIYYSYTDEGFTNWKSPYINTFLFSPLNGWLAYSPIIIIAIIGIIIGIKNKVQNSILTVTILVIAIYVFASWWCPNYGCAYGMRVMVEYYPLLIIPFSVAIIKIWSINSHIPKIMISLFILTCIIVNIDMLYYYDGCFYGNDWDWKAYVKLLEN